MSAMARRPLGVDRLRETYAYVQRHGSASVSDIADALQVSLQTVRRDLHRLEDQRLVERVYGGAVLAGGVPAGPSSRPDAPARTAGAAARRMADAAATLVRDGSTIFLSGGSVAEGVVPGLADREGLEALSMRRLGSELGVEAMSIYNHVPNKEALLDGVVEVLFTEMKVSLDDKNSWEDRVREVFRSFRGLAHSHPQIFPLFAVRPSNASKVVRVLPVFLDALRGSGVDVRTSLRAFRTLSSYTIGYALAEIRGFVLEEARGQYRALPGYGDNAAENAPPLEEADRDIEFEFGLDLILMGLREHRTRH